MLLFGLANLLKKVERREPGATPGGGRNSCVKQLLKGFMLNGINPFVLLFWFGIASMVTLNFRYNLPEEAAFFAAIVLTVFLLDLLKSYVAHRLRNILSERFMVWMNRIVGLALVLFSFRLFHFTLEALDALPAWMRF